MSGKKNLPENVEQSKESRGEILVKVCQCLHPTALGDYEPLRGDKYLPKDFRLVETEKKDHYWVQVHDNEVVRPVGADTVKKGVASAFSIRGTYLTPKDVDDIVRLAELNAESMDRKTSGTEKMILKEDKIAPMKFKTDPGWCWHRHDFDPTPVGKTEHEIKEALAVWEDEVFPRITENTNPFLSWCGSLAFEKTNRTMSPWLWGEGGSGKSAVCEFVMGVMGPAGCPLDPDLIMNDKHVAAQLIGKRIGYISEAPYKLVSTGKWKRLTGEATLQVNPKGKDAITSKIHIKMLISSNVFPTIKDGKEYERRIMPVHFKAPLGWEPTRQPDETAELLNKHAWYFWWRAVEEHKKDPFLKKIDKTRIFENRDNDDDRIAVWIAENLEFNVSKNTPVPTVKHAVMSSHLDWQKTREEICKFVKCEPRKIVKENYKSVWCFLNCRLRGNFGSFQNLKTDPEKDDENVDF